MGLFGSRAGGVGSVPPLRRRASATAVRTASLAYCEADTYRSALRSCLIASSRSTTVLAGIIKLRENPFPPLSASPKVLATWARRPGVSLLCRSRT